MGRAMNRPKVRIALWVLFVMLILLGIVMKRVFGMPAWVPVFHLTALMVLVAISVTAERREPAASSSEEEG